ncbi:DUF6443 domain-containing protein [uncultured Aquimarina sp.]|uniref:DUF6443 domain-containing protein n=1 Tax=uncultured Aquimarina sp. TaxID=575652 RepID=UPI002611E1BD|nr:DUF6443 domain-containing protein [uncultured Aquimarina sp.]
MIKSITTYITLALLFVSFAGWTQTPATIIKDGNYTVTGTENLTATQSIILKPNTWIKPGSTFTAIVAPDAYIDISLNQDENYVYTRVYQEAMSTANNIRNNYEVIESVAYFDGLGRPKQQVGIKASTNKKDIVTHIEYDVFGKQDKQYLPFESSGVIGSYKNVTIDTDINMYYQNKYADDFTGIDVSDVNAYSQSILELSPMSRVLEQGAPGKDWKANSSLDTDRTIKFNWLNNDPDEVVYFEVNFDQGNTEVPTLVKNGFYAADQLHVTITKDENWQPEQTHSDDHTTKEYKNKLGRVILKRTYNQGIAHDTHYVYDDFGNLTYVIPPKVSVNDGVSAEELAELCYQYKYDHRNRLVVKKIPGKGRESIVYNNLDQPILTQDAVQAPNEEWLFTKYDVFGRVIYTGTYSDDRGRNDMQFDINSSNQYDQKGTAVVVDNTTLYYTNTAFPNHSQQLLTINYYDDYTFDHTTTNPGTVLGQTIDTNAKGLPTGSKVRVLETDDWITTITYYDGKGRSIYVHSTNEYLNTVDVIESKLDFAGKVLETKTTHTKDNNTPIVTIDTFTYDHMGRLLDQKQTINDQAEEQIVANTYDELGQLESKQVGGTALSGVEGGLQKVDYTYNVRGWLTQINDPASLANDLFAFGINYNTTTENLGADPLYNGNISEISWKTANDNTKRAYGYQYDALNRIHVGTSNDGRYNLNNVSYDKNGNIVALQRTGAIVENPSHTRSGDFGTMDNLVYAYDNNNVGNKLVSVTDNSTSVFGFNDGNTGSADYVYDTNGNLTIDHNKGISNITYNYLNLPNTIGISNSEGTGNISYIYDATGAKLKKIVSGGSSLTTEYAGNYIYKNGALQFMNHPEGYIEPNGNGGFDYVYQLKDHLGNIRLSFSDKDNDGKIDVLQNNVDVDGDGDLAHEILQEKNYYPFGLQHKGYNNTITGREHTYGYNSKEEQGELGLEWLDFSARNYDPSLGRMLNIDPHADSYYGINPYNYTLNNPILLVDPDGKDSVISINGNTITVSTQIYIYGSGASENEAKEIQNLVNSIWGASNFGYTDEEGNEYDVVFDTNVEVYDEENTELEDGDNLVEIIDGTGRSRVGRDGASGKWYKQGQSGNKWEKTLLYPHEFGHLLGLDDRYSDNWLSKGSTPDRGWEDNIMASIVGDVEQRNIDGFLKDAVAKYNNFMRNYTNYQATKKTLKFSNRRAELGHKLRERQYKEYERTGVFRNVKNASFYFRWQGD